MSDTKTPQDWLIRLGGNGLGHNADCCCDRCKNGLETFLIIDDIKEIALYYYRAGMTDASNIVNEARSDNETDLRSVRDRIRSDRDSKVL